jgi:hypothetical protein
MIIALWTVLPTPRRERWESDAGLHWRMSSPHDAEGGEGDTADWNAGGDRRDSHITIPARPAPIAHHVRSTLAPRESRLRRPEKKHLTDRRVHTEQSKVSLLWQLSGTLRSTYELSWASVIKTNHTIPIYRCHRPLARSPLPPPAQVPRSLSLILLLSKSPGSLSPSC